MKSKGFDDLMKEQKHGYTRDYILLLLLLLLFLLLLLLLLLISKKISILCGCFLFVCCCFRMCRYFCFIYCCYKFDYQFHHLEQLQILILGMSDSLVNIKTL